MQDPRAIPLESARSRPDLLVSAKRLVTLTQKKPRRPFHKQGGALSGPQRRGSDSDMPRNLHQTPPGRGKAATEAGPEPHFKRSVRSVVRA